MVMTFTILIIISINIATIFRPISLLSVLSKPLERHVHHDLSTFMEKHNLFHTLQSGFRSKRSCHTALSAMCDVWQSAVDHSEIV